MEKKNTILLTVIAVATLLVAVVGSTFAFFAIQADNDANVTVQTTTAAAKDVFNATGSGAMVLDVTNDVMLEAESGDDVVAATASDSSLVVSLTAGTGVASCTYDLVWTDTSATKYAKTTATDEDGQAVTVPNEYTISGKADDAALAEIAEINVDEAGTLGNFTITNDAANGNTTTQTWTFTTKFYNLAVDQGAQMGKTYTGSVTVANVKCTNEAE